MQNSFSAYVPELGHFALVLALSGEMREAERLARSDLPPMVADNNIDV